MKVVQIRDAAFVVCEMSGSEGSQLETAAEKRDQPLPKLCTYKVVLSFMGFSLLMFAVLD